MMQRKVNSSRYQVISQIARNVLVIHVSIVASKFAFSMGERVLDSFRSSLSPNTVEVLICTHNQLKGAKKKRPMNLRECMDNVEDMVGFEIDTGVFFFLKSAFCLLYASIACLFVQCLCIILF